jgi:membrane protein YqaA with SNARE-associated domain
MTGFEQMLAEVAPWLHRYGYAAVAVAVLLEGTGIPLPGAILTGGAALLAGRGEMSLTAVLLTAWLAAMAGDNLGYWIGRGGGRRLLLKAGVSPCRLARFDGFFHRYGIWLILFGRFFDGTRQLGRPGGRQRPHAVAVLRSTGSFGEPPRRRGRSMPSKQHPHGPYRPSHGQRVPRTIEEKTMGKQAFKQSLIAVGLLALISAVGAHAYYTQELARRVVATDTEEPAATMPAPTAANGLVARPCTPT